MVRGPRRGVAGLSLLRPRAVPAILAALAILAPPPLTAQSSDGPTDGDGAAAAARPAPAQGAPDAVPPEDSAPRIAGFFDVPWHADSAAVAERMGPPISVARIEEGLRIFTYTPWFLDRDGFLGLWMREGEGMVHGTYEPVVGDCTEMLRQMVRELNRRHRRISPSTKGDVGSGPLRKDICLAAIEDSARLTVTWEDPQGNRIQVGSRPGRPELMMTGSSAAWLRR